MSDLMLTAVLSMGYDMAMADDWSRRQFYDRAQQALEEIERLTAERDELRRQPAEMRAALIAAMEIVHKERVRIAYNAKGAPPSIEIGYADILRRLDAVIAQADAALGGEG